MSRRQRPSVLTDRFDTSDLGTFDAVPIKGKTYSTETKQTTPAISFSRAMEIIPLLLKDYQSKNYSFVRDDKHYQVFPFMWYDLEVNDEIKNITTNEIYRVESLVTGVDDLPRNTVKLKCKNPPKSWHVLRVDDKKSRYVRFVPAFPDSEVKPYEFNGEGYLQTNEDPDVPSWVDTITYSSILIRPGSRSDGMFSGSNVELRPSVRESDPLKGDTYGQWRDNRIRLDFWTRDNKDSELFREWFDHFIMKYFWIIEANGLDKFMWTGDLMAETATRWRTNIVHRSSVYEFRTEYSYFKEMFKIRSITSEVIIPKDPSDVSVKGETIKITV